MPTQNDALKKAARELEALAQVLQYRKLYSYRPFAKQEEFHAQGRHYKFRGLFAGNQQGKTYAGAAEMAMHLTGEYPPWWRGRRWDRPIEAWVAGEGGLQVRDGPQTLLCGKAGSEEEWGTGLIPINRLVAHTAARGVADLFDTVTVKHSTNGVEDGQSYLSFKSYDQGRTKFQSKTLDLWWADEEPPSDIHGELVARISATDGSGFLTFTPLKGRTPLVEEFLDRPDAQRAYVQMGIDDGFMSTLSPEKKAGIIAGYKPHERNARVYGIPMQGEGAVFDIAPEALMETKLPMHQIPLHWRKIWGLDFGLAHPFAAVLILHDGDTDVIHVWDGAKVSDQWPIQHVQYLLGIGAEVPCAWPADGHKRDEQYGEIHLAYKTKGLNMLLDHATFKHGGNSVEEGIVEMQERMATGRLKVSESFVEWFNEMRQYHREKGLIVKVKDDLLDATRYAIMMVRYAKAVQLGSRRLGVAQKPRQGHLSEDWDPFTGRAT